MNQTTPIISDLQTLLQQVKPSLPPAFPPSDHFKDDWQLDSLDLVEYIARIEHRFQLPIPDSDLEKLTSIHAIEKYLYQRKPNIAG